MNKHFIRSMRQKGTIIIFSISTIESLKFNRTSATSFAINASFPCLSIDIIRYQRIIIYGLPEGKMTLHLHNDYHTTRNIRKYGLWLSQHQRFFHQTISSSGNWCIMRCFVNALQICLSPCEVLECLGTYGTMESGMLGGWETMSTILMMQSIFEPFWLM